jgi:hypothetical protein
LANPEPENLYVLFALEKIFSGPVSQEFSVVRQKNLENLIQMGLIAEVNIPSIEKQLSRRFTEELEKKKSAPPPYSIKVLRPKYEVASNWFQTLKERWRECISPMNVSVILLLAFVFMMYSSNPVRPKNATIGPVLASETDISGEIETIFLSQRTMLVKTDKKGTFLLQTEKSVLAGMVQGQKMTARVKPFRIQNDGTIVAQILSVK